MAEKPPPPKTAQIRVAKDGTAAPARPADVALTEERPRDDELAGYSEVAFEFQDSGEELALEGEAPEQQHGVSGASQLGREDHEFDGAALEQSTEAPPPAPEPPPSDEPASMQAALEITSYYSLDASHGIAGTSETPYQGLALEVRNLFAPVEEALHDRVGNAQAISVSRGNDADVRSRFAAEVVALVARRRVVPLVVKPSAIFCEGRAVMREPAESGAGLYRLHAAGVQTLTLVEGIDRREGEALARVFLTAAGEGTTAAEKEGDVSRWFWELGLLHARLSVLETFEEVEAPPETGIPLLDVPDQAVEQMSRLRSKLLASVPGAALSRTHQTAVRNLALSHDDRRALERDLFRLGADLLGHGERKRMVEPFPDLPPLDVEARQALDADLLLAQKREIGAFLQVALLLQEPERIAPIIDRLGARPRAAFAKGDAAGGMRFLTGLKDWSAGSREKSEVADAVLLRACQPATLLPLLEVLPPGPDEEALFKLLPPPATATLGILVARQGSLLRRFAIRLAADGPELVAHLGQLLPEQAAGLLDGAVAAAAPLALPLAQKLAEHEAPIARESAARAAAVLPAQLARPLIEMLLGDEESQVRKVAVASALAQKEPLLAAELLRAVGSARYQEWLFADKRAAMMGAAVKLGLRAREPLRRIAERQNSGKRRSLSETRAAALLGLALLKDAGDEKLAARLATEDERVVFVEAARALARSLRPETPAPGEREGLAGRLESIFARFDVTQDEDTAEAAKDEAAVRELSPQALQRMRIDDLLGSSGDKWQELPAALVSALSTALGCARSGKISSEQFVVAVGRATNLARAIVKLGEGAFSLQGFGEHFFVNGHRLRLPFAVYRTLGSLREVMESLRIGEIVFAEAPSRSDLIELMYAVVMALKTTREPWTQLERVFARIRLRELSLIRESWGRAADVAVDVRANAARLFGSLYLWLDDVARLPDKEQLLPLRAERLVRELTDAREEGESLLEGLIAPKKNPGDAALFVAHCTMLSGAFGRWLGARRDQVAALFRTAMHRQIGLLSSPRALLADLGSENRIEAAELLRTPLHSVARLAAAGQAGQELLLELVSAFECLAPLSARGGRAQRYLRPQEPLWCSRVLAVAERYLYLTTSFPNRPAASPDQALAEMLADPELDRRLVQAFANRAGIIPSGARVRLSDGSEGLVVSSPLVATRADPLLMRLTTTAEGVPAGDPLLGAPLVTLTGEQPIDITAVIGSQETSLEWSDLSVLLL